MNSDNFPQPLPDVTPPRDAGNKSQPFNSFPKRIPYPPAKTNGYNELVKKYPHFRDALETAFEDGYAEGYKEGYKEGYEEGSKEVRLQMAQAMNKKGFPPDMIAEIARLTPNEMDAYEESLKTYRDLKNSFDHSFENGKTEGKKETAQAMKKKGFPPDMIAEITRLPPDEILTL